MPAIFSYQGELSDYRLLAHCTHGMRYPNNFIIYIVWTLYMYEYNHLISDHHMTTIATGLATS